ncbi:acyltransferase family protein [Nocardioides gansuensis]|uniref:acyltransferase family protein n=1 Tax=Nocardioides gansuensis TaxID=2138300 RepID=UPI0014020FE5|nr:acyltransferase [Nocardioides gansuensis]
MRIDKEGRMRSTASPPALPWTDGVRALACAAVIVWHVVLTVRSAAGLGSTAIVTALGGLAHSAVLVFIVLSGYLLGRHWRGGAILPQTWLFVRRRTWRLVPTYWAALLLTLGTMVALGLDHPGGTHWDVGLPVSWGRTVLNFLMLTDIAGIATFSHPMWTVPFEYHLYLLAPLIAVLRSRSAALALGGLLVLLIALSGPPEHMPPFLGLSFVLAFSTGLRRQGMERPSAGLVAREVLPTVLLGGALVLATGGVLQEGASRYLALDAVLTPVVVGLLLLGDLGPGTDPARRALASAPLRWIGHRSYSIYLLHGVVIEALWRFVVAPLPDPSIALDVLLLTILSAAMSGVLGELLFRTVEQPTARRSAQVGRRPRVPVGVA